MGRKYIFYCDVCGKEFLNDDVHLEIPKLDLSLKYKAEGNKNWSAWNISEDEDKKNKNKQFCSDKCLFSWYSDSISKGVDALRKYLKHKIECNVLDYSRNNKWKEQFK